MLAHPYDEMEKKWPSTVVSRNQVRQFTGGMLSPGTMANMDSRGEGPERINIGRKVGYPIKPFIHWLKSRTSKKAA